MLTGSGLSRFGPRRWEPPGRTIGMDAMIQLQRLNGTDIGVNADLIERVESTPDTVLTLIDGTKYIVAERAEEVVARIIEFRARILAAAEAFSGAEGEEPAGAAIPLRLVGAAHGATEEAPGPAEPTSSDDAAVAPAAGAEAAVSEVADNEEGV